MSKSCSCRGFIGCERLSFWWYASFIFSSRAWCLYSATDLVSSLCNSSFLNSHICKECFQREDIIDLSNALITSSLRLRVRNFPHFLDIRPLRKFLQPIFDCSIVRRRHHLRGSFAGGGFRGKGVDGVGRSLFIGDCWKTLIHDLLLPIGLLVHQHEIALFSDFPKIRSSLLTR
jgi:hypothetical protein